MMSPVEIARAPLANGLFRLEGCLRSESTSTRSLARYPADAHKLIDKKATTAFKIDQGEENCAGPAGQTQGCSFAH